MIEKKVFIEFYFVGYMSRKLNKNYYISLPRLFFLYQIAMKDERRFSALFMEIQEI